MKWDPPISVMDKKAPCQSWGQGGVEGEGESGHEMSFLGAKRPGKGIHDKILTNGNLGIYKHMYLSIGKVRCRYI